MREIRSRIKSVKSTQQITKAMKMVSVAKLRRDILVKYKIALEINSLSRLPGHKIIRMAKARGIKFTFGTNNQNANIGRLEWALEAVKACGITKDDMWFPTDSVRLSRQTTIYNTIIE